MPKTIIANGTIIIPVCTTALNKSNVTGLKISRLIGSPSAPMPLKKPKRMASPITPTPPHRSRRGASIVSATCAISQKSGGDIAVPIPYRKSCTTGNPVLEPPNAAGRLSAIAMPVAIEANTTYKTEQAINRLRVEGFWCSSFFSATVLLQCLQSVRLLNAVQRFADRIPTARANSLFSVINQ